MDIAITAQIMVALLVRDATTKHTRLWYFETASEYGKLFVEQKVFKNAIDWVNFINAFVEAVPANLVEEDETF
jgi:hypothetical protein